MLRRDDSGLSEREKGEREKYGNVIHRFIGEDELLGWLMTFMTTRTTLVVRWWLVWGRQAGWERERVRVCAPSRGVFTSLLSLGIVVAECPGVERESARCVVVLAGHQKEEDDNNWEWKRNMTG